MTKNRLFKKEYAHELFRVAEADMQTAKALIAANIDRKENILFHIQQAIEKGLKSYICWLEKPVPLVPDLSELLREIPDSQKIPHNDELFDLSQFATIRRYEEGVAILEENEMKAAFKAGTDVLNYIRTKLK